MLEPVVQSALVEPLLEREVRVAALEALAEASQQFNKQLVSDVRTTLICCYFMSKTALIQ